MSWECQRSRAAKAAEREQGGGHVDDRSVGDVHGDRGDQPDHACGDAEQERADRGLSASATSWRWRKIGKTKAGRKMPRVIATPPASPPAR